MTLRTLAVVGTGLIGTSVALAARRRGVTVYLSDRDESAARTAAGLGAGRAEPPPHPVDLAVLAVPPSLIAPVLAQQQERGLALSYTDVASVKARPEREVLATAPDPARYVGGHPLSGRERSGPLAARADLFKDRPWVLTPTRLTDKPAFDRALDLIAVCGAVPRVLQARAHDDAVALTSHAPHLVASLMAARLHDGPAAAAHLAGQGLRDVTRIARGDSGLWSDIVESNAAAVAGILARIQDDLCGVLAALHDLAESRHGPRPGRSRHTLVDLLDRGIAGVEEVTEPRPADAVRPVHVQVAVADRPGALTRLLTATADAGIAPEDTTVRPAPGTCDGFLVRLAVDPLLAEALVSKLGAQGWRTEPEGPHLGGLPETAATLYR